MFKSAEWKGNLPIISVPFTETGAIDYRGFLRTLEYVEKTDVAGMVLFGIASEFYKLSDSEKSCLVRQFASFNSEKKKIVSVTDHSTYLAQENALLYQDLGMDGLMLLPPFFLSPKMEAIHTHIKTVLSTVQIPTILQIATKETGVNYNPRELFALYQQFPHLIFKMEGSPLPKREITELLSYSKDIHVFNGYAGKHMLEALDAGCCGIMPGCSFIDVYSKIYQMYFEAARLAHTIHQNLLKYIDKWMNSCEYIISVEKHILYKKGIIASPHCRKPNYELHQENREEIEDFLIGGLEN